nr:hypothetical protein [Pedobacter panaciterrae]
MTTDKAIRIFSDFLNSSWAIGNQLLIDRNYTSNEDSLNDWLQSNWEFLVERKILKINDHLEVYGDGADFNGASSRITDPNAVANFKIKVISKNNKPVHDVLNEEEVTLVNADFNKLIGFKNGFYIMESEFNFMLLDDKNISTERVVRLNDIEFELERL